MSNYRRHHYVPKFLLKQFSGDKKRTCVFQIRTSRVFKNVSLREQCSEDFFYGRSTSLESGFAQLEDMACKAIRKLANVDFHGLTNDEFLHLRQFVYFQMHRTRAAAERAQRLQSVFSKPFIKALAEREGLDPKLTEQVEFTFANPQFLALKASLAGLPAIMDLHCKLLVAPNDSSLILSDDPVVMNNQFSEHHPTFRNMRSSFGLALKGIQLFLPISPSICISFFDPGAYAYGSDGNDSCGMSKKDVTFLNALQIARANKCVYWHPDYEPSKKGFEQAKMISDRCSEKAPHCVEGPIEEIANGKKRQLIVASSEEIKVGAKFSFSRIIDRGKYEDHGRLPYRSNELHSLLKASAKMIDDLEKKGKPLGSD